MAKKKYYVGDVGPLMYEKGNTYIDQGVDTGIKVRGFYGKAKFKDPDGDTVGMDIGISQAEKDALDAAVAPDGYDNGDIFIVNTGTDEGLWVYHGGTLWQITDSSGPMGGGAFDPHSPGPIGDVTPDTGDFTDIHARRIYSNRSAGNARIMGFKTSGTLRWQFRVE